MLTMISHGQMRIKNQQKDTYFIPISMSKIKVYNTQCRWGYGVPRTQNISGESKMIKKGKKETLENSLALSYKVKYLSTFTSSCLTEVKTYHKISCTWMFIAGLFTIVKM